MSKFVIEIRTKGFGKAEAELKRTGEQTRSFARSANNASNAGAVFRKEVSQLRNNMLLYSFAIVGTISAMGKFVKAASDAREQMSQFNVVFGDFAPEAEKFANSMQSSFGIAKSEMVALLASLQDTFVPLGFSREKAAELSMAMAQLSIDVGSFKNIATGDVASRMTSAIIGNHEAVRSLGIALTEATIKEEALRTGMISANEEMSNQVKVLARASLIFNNTTDAHGDYIRTQDEFANRLRAVTGQLTDMTVAIGETLIPAAELGINFINFAVNGRRAAIVAGGLTIALGSYAVSAGYATTITALFTKTLSRNPIIFLGTMLALSITEVAAALGFFGKKTEEATIDVKNLGQVSKELAEEQINIKDSTDAASKAQQEQIDKIEQSETALRVRLAVMHETTELEKARVTALIQSDRILSNEEVLLLKGIDAQIAKNKETREAIRLAAEQARLMQQMADAEQRRADTIASMGLEELRIRGELDGMTDLQIEKMGIVHEQAGFLAEQLNLPYSDLVANIKDHTKALDAESIGLVFADEQTQQLVQSSADLTNAKLDMAESASVAAIAAEELTQKNKEADLQNRDNTKSMNLYAASILAVGSAMATFQNEELNAAEKQKMFMKQMMSAIGGVLMMIPGFQVPGALLTVGSQFVAHTGGLIGQNGVQRFANGGMVKGQDNVPILAQSGEFVMQRSAVQNIGVENLANMNAGGSPGNNVTVNISAPLVDDHIVDTLIPAINKAVASNTAQLNTSK